MTHAGSEPNGTKRFVYEYEEQVGYPRVRGEIVDPNTGDCYPLYGLDIIYDVENNTDYNAQIHTDAWCSDTRRGELIKAGEKRSEVSPAGTVAFS
ncbi:hypothetical protein ACFPZ0_22695 [Streptomonospora nanhaiensis]|uniref:Uncharacterized protein n=1 Tax=Streptomonospora nanhaiensis TaxID=1323731 RepID=A0A853BVU1_9ACTN|nr:hypothetical protein [Streptomonospora nanhaiensis]MBV2366905.1 hypothetical protein [Streptomonospora nanhaiensis]MBX9390807.1 hypothetical protein [Streptomonospora nanhaiensis]NYI99203.1 hypothetical protein [Streptomonospora nanhaiensis]